MKHDSTEGAFAPPLCPVCHGEVADDHDPEECAELVDEAARLELERLLWEVV